MKAGKDAFKAVCNLLCSDPRFKRALAKCKIHETTGYRWLLKSRALDERFKFVWLDDEPTFFHVAVQQAQTMYYNSLIQEVEKYALYGKTRETRFKGERVYRRDPELDIFSDEQLIGRGITSRYLRDELGQLIPETEHYDAPVQLQLAVLQARAPKIYSTKISHDVTSRVSLGVTVKPAPAIPPPVSVVQPPAIEPPRDVIEGEYTEAAPQPLDFLDEPPKPPRGFKIG
jgi:hypothetical protein